MLSPVNPIAGVPVHSVTASCLRKAVDTRRLRFGPKSYEADRAAAAAAACLSVEGRRARAKERESVRYSKKKGRSRKRFSCALLVRLFIFPLQVAFSTAGWQQMMSTMEDGAKRATERANRDEALLVGATAFFFAAPTALLEEEEKLAGNKCPVLEAIKALSSAPSPAGTLGNTILLSDRGKKRPKK